jgi:hypothetical protein
MATAASLLTSTEAAIEALLTAIANPMVEEYQIGNRRVRRPDFARTLDALQRSRALLKREVARTSNNPVRVISLGRSAAVDR